MLIYQLMISFIIIHPLTSIRFTFSAILVNPSSTMRITITILFLLISVIVIGKAMFSDEEQPVTGTQSHGEALIGGPFSLTNHTGEVFTESNLLGKYSLIYFGFTYCPEICPSALSVISNTLDEMGSDADAIIPVFITVDPERDTQEVLAEYVTNFHDHLVGLTGTSEQIKQAADAYKVYYVKQEQKDSAIGYLVDHSSYIFLMGPDGKYITHFPHTVAQGELADKLKAAIRQ